MMVGPGTLAAALYVSEAFGILIAALALLVNGLLNAALLIGADKASGFLDRGVVRTVGKVFGLLLAAMAISMFRAGVSSMMAGT
jgi:small neutral amino acid transporter SnatA (MarC family)